MKLIKNNHFWEKNRGTFRSKIGGWRPNEAVYNSGYSMLDDLVGSASFFQVLVLNCTGKLPDKSLADWIEASFVCLSWPDPRVWCNKMGTLAGNMRCTPAAAVTAGVLSSDSRMYAAGALDNGTAFITSALAEKNAGISTKIIIERALNKSQRNASSKPAIMGYARPIASGDERIPAMERVTKQLGFEIGPHLTLAYEIDKILRLEFDESMNILGYCVAFLSDQGLKKSEINTIFSTWVNSGVHACYTEAMRNPPESFLPMHCSDILYLGPSPREVPKKESHK